MYKYPQSVNPSSRKIYLFMNIIVFIVGIFSVGGSVVINSLFEWLVHGPVMHGTFGTRYLQETHKDHHKSFEDNHYKNTDHGPHVHLPWWSMILTVGIMSIFGLLLSRLTGYQTIFWCMTVTSLVYYYTYQYVHTLMHVPITNRFDQWIVNTRVFKKLDAHHRVHHLASVNEPWGTLVNIGLLCTLGDHLMGTKYSGKKSAAKNK